MVKHIILFFVIALATYGLIGFIDGDWIFSLRETREKFILITITLQYFQILLIK